MEDILKQVLFEVRKLKKEQSMIKTCIENLDAVQKQLIQGQARIELELAERVRALFDSHEIQQDVNNNMANSLERIEAKVDVLQMETSSIRRAI